MGPPPASASQPHGHLTSPCPTGTPTPRAAHTQPNGWLQRGPKAGRSVPPAHPVYQATHPHMPGEGSPTRAPRGPQYRPRQPGAASDSDWARIPTWPSQGPNPHRDPVAGRGYRGQGPVPGQGPASTAPHPNQNRHARHEPGDTLVRLRTTWLAWGSAPRTALRTSGGPSGARELRTGRGHPHPPAQGAAGWRGCLGLQSRAGRGNVPVRPMHPSRGSGGSGV